VVSRSSSSCAEAKLVQPELYRDIVIATEPGFACISERA
jgi:hypothetical protein